MRGPSLQKTALLSFVLHMTAFMIVLLMMKQSNHMVMPSPYTVNLVGPEITARASGPKSEEIAHEPEHKQTYVPAAEPKKSSREAAKEKKLVEDRLSELSAKKKSIDALRRLHDIISLKASAGKQGGAGTKTNTSAVRGGSAFDVYYSKITKEIWDQWTPPSFGRKDLEAIVSIKILKDGTTIVQKVEKSSGDRLFDRSALRALAKANPLPPPPNEMEIGVKFHP